MQSYHSLASQFNSVLCHQDKMLQGPCSPAPAGLSLPEPPPAPCSPPLPPTLLSGTLSAPRMHHLPQICSLSKNLPSLCFVNCPNILSLGSQFKHSSYRETFPESQARLDDTVSQSYSTLHFHITAVISILTKVYLLICLKPAPPKDRMSPLFTPLLSSQWEDSVCCIIGAQQIFVGLLHRWTMQRLIGLWFSCLF